MRLNKHQIGVVVLLLFTVLQWWLNRTPSATTSSMPTVTQAAPSEVPSSTHALADGWIYTGGATSTNALVVHVVDGDTIEAKLDGQAKTEKIRFLGVNTPESVDPRRPVQCFGKEASNFMKQLLDQKRIRLEADPQADERDKYQRLLRNLVSEEGIDVNASLVSLGYAQAYVSFPQNPQRKQQLRQLEATAKQQERGLWNPSTCAGQK